MRMMISIVIGMLMSTLSVAANFTIKSQGFENKGKIPDKYTCEGGSVTPSLIWSNPPDKTKSFALTFKSLDTPVGLLYNWILYNIPNNVSELKEGIRTLPEGTVVGPNSFGEEEYRAPCPPDTLVHRYIITIYALDIMLDLPNETDADGIMYQMKNHVLDKAELTGTFSH